MAKREHRDSVITLGGPPEPGVVHLLYISIITYVISPSQQLPKEDVCTNGASLCQMKRRPILGERWEWTEKKNRSGEGWTRGS